MSGRVPANPGAWPTTADKRHTIDAIRRDRMRKRKHKEIAQGPDGALDGMAELWLNSNLSRESKCGTQRRTDRNRIPRGRRPNIGDCAK